MKVLFAFFCLCASNYSGALHSYGSASLQTVQVFTASNPNGSTVVLIHGGGFKSSAQKSLKMDGPAKDLTAYGDTVFVVNYRDDSKGVGIADQVSDVVSGVDWVIAHASHYGADPSDLTLIGGSAGGLLTGDAAERLNNSSPGTVRAVVTLSASEDFAAEIAYWSAYPPSVALPHLRNLTQTLGCPDTGVGCSTALETAYSPDQQVTAANCPAQWVIFNGTKEMPLSQPEAMDNALLSAGCPQVLDILPSSAHAFAYWSEVEAQVQGVILTTLG